MKNILVVEDTEAIREELCDILRMEGFSVIEADNGIAALDIAKKEKLNLIISDVLMPGLDGFELYKELEKNNLTKEIPFIFLSAKANKDAIVKGLRMGAKDYIIKPVSPDELLFAVNDKINR